MRPNAVPSFNGEEVTGVNWEMAFLSFLTSDMIEYSTRHV